MAEGGVDAAALAAQLAAAEAETRAVRDKLHNAVRKGKGIDAEKRALAKEVDALRLRLDAADTSTAAAVAEAAAEHEAAQRATLEATVREASTQVRDREITCVCVSTLVKPSSIRPYAPAKCPSAMIGHRKRTAFLCWEG